MHALSKKIICIASACFIAALLLCWWLRQRLMTSDFALDRSFKVNRALSTEWLKAAVPFTLEPVPCSMDAMKAALIASEFYSCMVDKAAGGDGYVGSITIHAYTINDSVVRLKLPCEVAGRQLAIDVSTKLSSGEDLDSVKTWANEKYRMLVDTVGYDFACSTNSCFGVTSLFLVLDKPNYLGIMDIDNLGDQPSTVIRGCSLSKEGAGSVHANKMKPEHPTPTP